MIDNGLLLQLLSLVVAGIAVCVALWVKSESREIGKQAAQLQIESIDLNRRLVEVHERQEKLDTYLGEHQLAQIEKSAEEQRKADIRLDREALDRLYVTNNGPSVARKVNLEFTGPGGTGTPLIDGDANRKLPHPELRPGDSLQLILGVSGGCAPPWDFLVSWIDDSCENGERNSRTVRVT